MVFSGMVVFVDGNLRMMKINMLINRFIEFSIVISELDVMLIVMIVNILQSYICYLSGIGMFRLWVIVRQIFEVSNVSIIIIVYLINSVWK